MPDVFIFSLGMAACEVVGVDVDDNKSALDFCLTWNMLDETESGEIFFFMIMFKFSFVLVACCCCSFKIDLLSLILSLMPGCLFIDCVEAEDELCDDKTGVFDEYFVSKA